MLLAVHGVVRRGGMAVALRPHPDPDGSTDPTGNHASGVGLDRGKVVKRFPDKAELPGRVRALRSRSSTRRGQKGLRGQYTDMTFATNLLVVADETLDSPELVWEIERRAADRTLRVSVLAPVPAHQRAESEARLERLTQRLTDFGIPTSGVVGDSIPLVALSEIWSPARYDEILVCTLPAHMSTWLRIDLPSRIADLTGARVCHITAAPGAAHTTRDASRGERRLLALSERRDRRGKPLGRYQLRP
jgi:hypothetical protein